MRTSVSTRVSAAVAITLLGSGFAAASPPHHDQLRRDRQLAQAAPASDRAPTGQVDARLNNIIDTRDIDDAELLRGPPEHKQAVDRLVGELGDAEEKVGSPDFPSIGRVAHDAAHDALRTPH